MIKIANIYPVANQVLYKEESVVMILAHLLSAGKYNPAYFRGNKYIILDNGAFEGERTSSSLLTYIDLAKDSDIAVDEIVIPDMVGSTLETIRMFEDNLRHIKDHPEYNYMFVAQGTQPAELEFNISYINRYAGELDNLVVGIPKIYSPDRRLGSSIESYKKCLFPIHFLGIRTTFSELDGVKDLVRSCDTSQISYLAKNESTDVDVWNYERRVAARDKDKDVDLEVDYLDESKLLKLKDQVINHRW